MAEVPVDFGALEDCDARLVELAITKRVEDEEVQLSETAPAR